MKEKCTIIRSNKYILSTMLTKRNIIVLILLIHTMYTRIELLEADEADKTTFGDKNDIRVYPDKELSAVSGWIVNTCGYIPNLRKHLPCIIDSYFIHTGENASRISRSFKYLLNNTRTG
ncbi:hypothetical protein NEIG_01631 [Nematocida sp. ERTm5]|nr:hypothetical protein NEIG_01631 [Nematocida sp. ERTm5]